MHPYIPYMMWRPQREPSRQRRDSLAYGWYIVRRLRIVFR